MGRQITKMELGSLRDRLELILTFKNTRNLLQCSAVGSVFGIVEMVYGGEKLFGISWTVMDDVGVLDGPGIFKCRCIGLLVMFVGQLVFHQAR